MTEILPDGRQTHPSSPRAGRPRWRRGSEPRGAGAAQREVTEDDADDQQAGQEEISIVDQEVPERLDPGFVLLGRGRLRCGGGLGLVRVGFAVFVGHGMSW